MEGDSVYLSKFKIVDVVVELFLRLGNKSRVVHPIYLRAFVSRDCRVVCPLQLISTGLVVVGAATSVFLLKTKFIYQFCQSIGSQLNLIVTTRNEAELYWPRPVAVLIPIY